MQYFPEIAMEILVITKINDATFLTNHIMTSLKPASANSDACTIG